MRLRIRRVLVRRCKTTELGLFTKTLEDESLEGFCFIVYHDVGSLKKGVDCKANVLYNQCLVS